MPIFIERYLLAVLASATIVYVALNPMNFDWIQRVTLGIGIIGLAAFFAQTLYRHNQSAKERVTTETSSTTKEESKPDLRGEIQDTIFGREGDREENTGIVFVMSIRNTGAPTIVERWDLIADIPNVGRLATTMPYFEGKLNLPSKDYPDKTVVYSADDLLTKKTLTPIQTNGVVHGLLVFLLKGVKQDVVYQKGTKLELSFADATGKRYRVIKEAGTGVNNQLGVLPGMKTDILTTATPQAQAEAAPINFDRKVLLKGGERHRLSTLLSANGYKGSTLLQALDIQNLDDNSENLYWGQSDVSEDSRYLLPGESYNFPGGADAAQVYLLVKKDMKIGISLRSR